MKSRKKNQRDREHDREEIRSLYNFQKMMSLLKKYEREEERINK